MFRHRLMLWLVRPQTGLPRGRLASVVLTEPSAYCPSLESISADVESCPSSLPVGRVLVPAQAVRYMRVGGCESQHGQRWSCGLGQTQGLRRN